MLLVPHLSSNIIKFQYGKTLFQSTESAQDLIFNFDLSKNN